MVFQRGFRGDSDIRQMNYIHIDRVVFEKYFFCSLAVFIHISNIIIYKGKKH